MAAILTADIMEGASIEVSPGNVRVSRVFLAENIPTNIPRALLPLALLTDGLPRWGEPHPELQTAAALRYMVRPTGEPNSAFIEVVYEQTQYMNFATWYVVDDSTVTQEMADRNPIGQQIRAIFTQPGLAGDNGKIIPFPGAVPRMVGHRTISVSGLLRHPPGEEVLEAVEGPAVNQKVWMGKRPGWWMCTRARVDAHLTANRLAKESGIQAKGVGIAAVFMARYRDWREFLTYYDRTGKPSQVDPGVAAKLYAEPYTYAQVEREKITAIGQYPMMDFRDIFGFGETGTLRPPIGNSWGKQTHTG